MKSENVSSSLELSGKDGPLKNAAFWSHVISCLTVLRPSSGICEKIRIIKNCHQDSRGDNSSSCGDLASMIRVWNCFNWANKYLTLNHNAVFLWNEKEYFKKKWCFFYLNNFFLVATNLCFCFGKYQSISVWNVLAVYYYKYPQIAHTRKPQHHLAWY